MARRTIPPGEKAQKALDAAEREVKRLTEQSRKLEVELKEIRGKLDVAVKRRVYLGQNPDLPQSEPEPADAAYVNDEKQAALDE